MEMAHIWTLKERGMMNERDEYLEKEFDFS